MSVSPLRAILSGFIGHLAGLAGTCSLVLLTAGGLVADASPQTRASLSSRPAATFGACLLLLLPR